jgi:hypothetical protein
VEIADLDFAIMVIALNVIRAGIVMAVIGVINILASKNKINIMQESDSILLMIMALTGTGNERC